MTSSIIYTGHLRCQATHLQSGSVIETDAPTDNKGKGERFSPTDLLCVSLATCIVTTMGIKALDMDIDLSQTSIELTKHMASDPRRVAQINVTFNYSSTLMLTQKDKTILERVSHTCPVAQSLHPNVVLQVVHNWAE
jgi:putative redox protein